MFNWWFHGRQVECGYAHCALLPYVGHFHDMLQLCKNWRDLEEKEKSGLSRKATENTTENRPPKGRAVGREVPVPGYLFQGNLGEGEIFLDLLARKLSSNHWCQENAGLLPLGKFTKRSPKGSLIVFQASFVQGFLLLNFRCVTKTEYPKPLKKEPLWLLWLADTVCWLITTRMILHV